MVVVEESPFVFSGPAPPDDVVGRDDLLAALANRASAGRFVLLAAPRRYGKTSLVRRLQRDAHRRKRLVVVIVDLLGVATAADISARMAQAWQRIPAGAVERAVAKLARYLPELTLAAGPATVTARRPDRTAEARTMEAVLDLPYRVAERLERRVLVVLDEFQAVAAVAGADATIRSQIQHQTERVAYLFCGSEPSTLKMLFTNRSAPLYGQAESLTLPGLSPEAAGEFIDGRFAATGRRIDDPALALVLEFTGIWTLLSAPQRKTARLAAWGESFYGAAARQLALSKSSAQRATLALREAGITDERDELVDPLFAEWLRRQSPHR